MTPLEKAISEALKREEASKPTRKGLEAVRGVQGHWEASLADGTSLERQFDTLLDQIAPDLPKPEGYRGTPQLRPIVGRDFRADRFFPPSLIIECEGSDHRKTWTYEKDLEKYNLISLAGYVLLRCTKRMLDEEPEAFFSMIRQALHKKG